MQEQINEERKQLEIERKLRMERVKKQREEQEKNPAAPASGPQIITPQQQANQQAANKMISINGTTESGIIQTVQLNPQGDRLVIRKVETKIVFEKIDAHGR